MLQFLNRPLGVGDKDISQKLSYLKVLLYTNKRRIYLGLFTDKLTKFFIIKRLNKTKKVR